MAGEKGGRIAGLERKMEKKMGKWVGTDKGSEEVDEAEWGVVRGRGQGTLVWVGGEGEGTGEGRVGFENKRIKGAGRRR